MQILILCAWCDREMGTREWKNGPRIDPPPISHGICPPCAARLLDEAAAVVARRFGRQSAGKVKTPSRDFARLQKSSVGTGRHQGLR